MRFLLLPLLLSLSACGFMGGWLGGGDSGPTLADLDPVELPPVEEEAVPAVGLDELAQIYLDVLAVTEDPEVRVTVLERLAGIEMLMAEAKLANGEPAPDLFDEAIEAYSALLEKNPDIEGRDRLLYQLSKAHDMTGNPDAAMDALEQLSSVSRDSVHYTEAQFRIAESHFSAGRYREAQVAYEEVISAGEDTPYYLNALYMHGWSQFKQGDYRQSIRSYTETLDRLVPADNKLENLSSADQALVNDCFRVLAVVFSYLEGVDTIVAAYDQLGQRSYEPLLYQDLGELYLKQERYRDSAETFREFSRRYPESEFAHRFHVRVIGIYERAGFRDLIVQEKRDYVASYGIHGDYFLLSDAEVQQEIVENLTLFIEELATHYHALAQTAEDPAAAAENYSLAGDYYRLYIDSFPEDERVPEMGFLLAEARTEAGQHAEAVETFEWVAYEFPDYERAADAGYAAIVGYEPILEVSGEDEKILEKKAGSQIRFASRFGYDKRAPSVLNDAAATAFKANDYTLAIIAAAALMKLQPSNELLVPAGLVMANSYFEIGEYEESSSGYRTTLARMSASDDRRDATVERLAASLYRRAEQVAAEGDSLAAAREFEQVLAETPSASFRRQAQFDAAQSYMEAGDFQRANRLLQDFQRRYGDDPLAGQVPLKLVYNFEQMGDWESAAREMDKMLPAENDPERKRELLYLSAEYYEKAGKTSLALERYRSYANEWPQPLGPRMEAMNKLTELYAQRGEPANRRYWLRKIQDAHEGAGSAKTDRSLYLAAKASSVFADDYYQEFLSVKLRHPVDKSLKKKRAAMDQAMQAYQKTNGYGVSEFASLATFRMGEIYRQLSIDLMESERPRGLDALALEQYELLLEEQAFPFEEKAIAIHEANMRRSWEGWYDEWIKSSFDALAGLSPARYAKRETVLAYSEEIY